MANPASRPPSTEKILQHSASSVWIAGTADFRAMMACRQIEKAGAMQNRTTLGVFGGKDDSGNPRHGNRPAAHGAGLQRDVEGRSDQPFIAKAGCGGPDHQDFGVRGGIFQLQDAIPALREDITLPRNQNGPHGHLAPLSCRLGFRKRQCYGLSVIHR